MCGIVNFVVLGALLLGGVGCNPSRKAEASVETNEAMPAPRLRLRVVRPRKEASSGERVLPGVLLPWQRAQLGARVAGELTRITVDRGDHVERGQLLATIGIPGLAEDVERAHAHRRTAQAELSSLEDQRQRVAKAVDAGPAGVIAEGEIAALDAKVEAAKARIASAAAELGHGGAMLADTRIVAPFTGTVAARRVDRGSALSAGSIIVEVVDVSTLRMTFDVPERDAAAVKVGQRVTVIVPALRDRRVDAKIARFAPALDEATRTLRVEADVPNVEGAMLAGVSARAAIDLGSRGEVLVLPADAVIQVVGEAFVYVMDGAVARKRKVVIGYDRGPFVEISSGLKGDEEIVTGGRGLVRDGAACEVAR
ncbi:MAG TPA: efflux RND transporter periplasmic adaptor subunit [Polyangiaceae bacterium]|jgi:RND family efflux transporter MFP subunit|nr:efflux RND transporter periplasmic adaptor subunit [Polyangiaceae bacterium]